jgi:hypothetical protein
VVDCGITICFSHHSGCLRINGGHTIHRHGDHLSIIETRIIGCIKATIQLEYSRQR